MCEIGQLNWERLFPSIRARIFAAVYRAVIELRWDFCIPVFDLDMPIEGLSLSEGIGTPQCITCVRLEVRISMLTIPSISRRILVRRNNQY